MNKYCTIYVFMCIISITLIVWIYLDIFADEWHFNLLRYDLVWKKGGEGVIEKLFCRWTCLNFYHSKWYRIWIKVLCVLRNKLLDIKSCRRHLFLSVLWKKRLRLQCIICFWWKWAILCGKNLRLWVMNIFSNIIKCLSHIKVILTIVMTKKANSYTWVRLGS